jgi:hypothetical protein
MARNSRKIEFLKLNGAILPYDTDCQLENYTACFHAGCFKKTLREHVFPGVSDGPRGLMVDRSGLELHFRVIRDHWSFTGGTPRREFSEIALVAVLPAERPAAPGDAASLEKAAFKRRNDKESRNEISRTLPDVGKETV